ncbi:MAG: hypothetical protein QOK19_1720 [Solirubrobacteraceae bacterium]|jgi:hypothetical protein|nr:hypothetical protein [Solirubrobacterales bacterium]MEA2216159.1 hypothetical protein [Solirubrobacteraceae bacterium]
MLRRTVLVACFITAFAVTAASAQAVGPHWIWGPKKTEEIPAGKPVPVATEGTLTFTVTPVSGKPLKTKCQIEDRELIENPLGGGPGVDEMLSFNISGCTGKAACSTGALISFQAVGLPWLSLLQPGTPPIDEIKGVEIQEQCSGAVLSTYTGTLTPTVSGSALNFGGASSGTLEDAFKNKLTLKGKDKMTGPPPKTKIGAI